MAGNRLAITCEHWDSAEVLVSPLRRTVFLDEQKVPEADEFDGLDPEALHFIARDDEQVVGCARLLPSNQIGRLAVLANARRKGIGQALIQDAVLRALQDHPDRPVFLHAQTAAEPFYRTRGFHGVGDEFQDAGIPHRKMVLDQDRLPELLGDRVLRFSGPAEAVFYLARIIATGGRELSLYSRDLSHLLYHQEQVANAVSTLARGHRHSRLRILVQDSQALGAGNHALVELARRLSSSIEIRVTTKEADPTPTAFAIADRDALVFFNDEAACEGFANFRAPLEARQKLDEFDYLWEKLSERDPNLATFVL